MKKIFTTAFVLTAALTPFVSGAQDGTPTQRLNRVIDNEYGEYYSFTYDEAGKVTQIDEYFDMRVRTAYAYNDKNQCTRQTLYQEIPVGSGNLYATAYYDFTYNDMGRMATSTLYSNFKPDEADSQFERQVKEYYDYDDAGRVTKSESYWDTGKTIPYNKIDRAYNASGLLAEKTETTYNFSFDALAGILQDTYTYDEGGKLLTVCTKRNDDQMTLRVSEWTVYEYAADGNLVERYTTGSVNSPEQKITRLCFTVDEDVPASTVVYPSFVMPYRESELYHLFENQILTADEYYPDDDTGFAGPSPYYAWEYEYDYLAGIAAVSEVAGKRLSGAVVTGDVLHLTGVLSAGNVRIVDLGGREVMSVRGVANRVDVSGLAKGVYVVTTDAGSAKFVR